MMIRTENKETFAIEYWYVQDNKEELVRKCVKWEREKEHAKGTFAEQCYKAVGNPYKAELIQRFGLKAWEDVDAWLYDYL